MGNIISNTYRESVLGVITSQLLKNTLDHSRCKFLAR